MRELSPWKYLPWEALPMFQTCHCTECFWNSSFWVSLGASGMFFCTTSVITNVGPLNMYLSLEIAKCGEWSRRSCWSHKFLFSNLVLRKIKQGTSLVTQWLRICLPMQGTRVRALVREDPTCRGATKPVHHNYWACTLEPTCHNYWSLCATTTEACVPQILKPACLEPMLRNKRSHRSEKHVHHNKE